MKIVHIIAIVLAGMLILAGLVYPVPEKTVEVYGYSDTGWTENRGIKYVGGDAYNYQIEASLKGGYVSGVLTLKSVMVTGGVLLVFISLFDATRRSELARQTELLQRMADRQTAQAPLVQPAHRVSNEQPAERQQDVKPAEMKPVASTGTPVKPAPEAEKPAPVAENEPVRRKRYTDAVALLGEALSRENPEERRQYLTRLAEESADEEVRAVCRKAIDMTDEQIIELIGTIG